MHRTSIPKCDTSAFGAARVPIWYRSPSRSLGLCIQVLISLLGFGGSRRFQVSSFVNVWCCSRVYDMEMYSPLFFLVPFAVPLVYINDVVWVSWFGSMDYYLGWRRLSLDANVFQKRHQTLPLEMLPLLCVLWNLEESFPLLYHVLKVWSPERLQREPPSVLSWPAWFLLCSLDLLTFYNFALVIGILSIEIERSG